MDDLPVISSLYHVQCHVKHINTYAHRRAKDRFHAVSHTPGCTFTTNCQWWHGCESHFREHPLSSTKLLSTSCPWTSALPPPPFLPPPSLLPSKLEALSHHPRFSSNLVGSKVASWAWAGSRWLHAQGDQAKALQVLTPPLPWVPG